MKPNPFPGMNPWLEQHWGDVHTITATGGRVTPATGRFVSNVRLVLPGGPIPKASPIRLLSPDVTPNATSLNLAVNCLQISASRAVS